MGQMTVQRKMKHDAPPFLIIRIADIVRFGSHQKQPQHFSENLDWDSKFSYKIFGITYHSNSHFTSCIKYIDSFLFYDGLDSGGLKRYEDKYIENSWPNHIIYIRVLK